ncbi:putative HTH-type transcriptional regulator YwhA [Paenibacillus sp. J45TS6]|uniref:MarR family transcriptional regulator n=1 Tax=Paenibacillus polygoni TaxID=3050112 RepID=A0ABY8X0A7_9BACL|nr:MULTISPECIES: MarR family transcriptional regulator [Paenibacillus]WIV17881.1 MarR family transcriptional regulator [Paenibacillus polygoni]GIP41583.1 putative HTH-type transcriptional regulator YwhA [Paenibacillus sp. J45TS6]
MHSSEFVKLWSILTKDYKSHMEQELAPVLTEAQLTVLELLLEHPRMKPSEFTPYLATTPAAVTMLLDRMEKHELIERRRDDRDRRVVWITLSEKGRLEAVRGTTIREEFIDQTLSKISSHNQQLLVYLLSKITTQTATTKQSS